MQTQANNSISTLSNTLANKVVVQVFDGGIGRAKLDHLLIRLTLTLILLCFVQRMSIVNLSPSRLSSSLCSARFDLIVDWINDTSLNFGHLTL